MTHAVGRVVRVAWGSGEAVQHAQVLRRLFPPAMLVASALAVYLPPAGGGYLDEAIERPRHTTDLQDENTAWGPPRR